VGKTLLLTLVSMAIAVVFGVLLALMRTAKDPTLRAVSWVYVGFMRSVPLIVLILFVYFMAVLLPNLTIGLPFGGPQWLSWDTNEVITPFTAAIIALGFGEAAYTSEIVRGGLLAVSKGQSEAATALGMPPGMIFARVTLPQAFRVIVPGLGNEAIGMLKATALVQIIGYTELLTTAQRIYAVNFQTIPLLLVVTAWYLALTVLGTILQSRLEKRMNRAY
jgi:polar amino acid transport system permease protein